MCDQPLVQLCEEVLLLRIVKIKIKAGDHLPRVQDPQPHEFHPPVPRNVQQNGQVPSRTPRNNQYVPATATGFRLLQHFHKDKRKENSVRWRD